MVLAWENLQRFSIILLLLFFFFIYLHLLMFFILLLLYLYLISRLLCHVTGTPPWLLRPVKVSTSSELYPDYFRLLFLFHLPQVLQFWVGIFYPQAFLYLTLLPNILAFFQHFGTTCFYHGFTRSRQLLFWKLPGFIMILETHTRPICLLIHSNPQPFIHLSFVFMLINIAEVLLMVKTLIRSAATLFISHENIKLISNQTISAYLNYSLKKYIT